MFRAYIICYVRNMALFAWGLDEIAEAIGLFYVLIVGLLIALVAMNAISMRNQSHRRSWCGGSVANGSMGRPTSILARYRSG
jgi:hypothetical protein